MFRSLLLLSDLHLEFEPFIAPLENDCSLVILAGDIHIQDGAWPIIESFLEAQKQVIYVPGNHEYYGSSIDAVDEYWFKLSASVDGFHYLNGSSICIDGTTFHGATLWTDYDNEDPQLMHDAENEMSDFLEMRPGVGMGEPNRSPTKKHERYRAEDFLAIHRNHVRFLQECIKPGDIVITHHAPSHKSIPYSRELEPRGLYSSDLEDLIKQNTPRYWMHGHFHSSLRYRIFETEVICNPRGYIGHYPNSRFDPEFSIPW